MKRVIIIGLALALMLSASAFATETRTITMGDNNNVMVDDFNQFRYPGRVNSYPNISLAEFADVSGSDFFKFGINWKFGDDNPWVLGTHFVNESSARTPDDFYGQDMSQATYRSNFLNFYDPTDPANLDELSTNHRIDLLYGRKLGSNDFGMRFEYVHSSVTRDRKDTTAAGVLEPYDVTKKKFATYNFVFGLTEGSSGQWDAALGLLFGSWTDKDESDSALTEPDGYLDFTLEGRYFWVRNPTITLVPHAGFAYGSRGAKNTVALGNDQDDFTVSNKGLMLDGGLGMNYTPSSNLLAVSDIGFMYQNVKTEFTYPNRPPATATSKEEYTLTNFSILFFKIGLEADVFRWMDVRFGATSYWNIETGKLKDGDENSEDKYAWAQNDTYLGVAFHWGRLHIDTQIDPEFVINMPYFISGDDTSDMAFRVSALYEMF